MKTLYIMRHSQKEEPIGEFEGFDDFDLPISKTGVEKTHEVGKKLQQLNVNPDLIVSSPSQRTKITANIVKEYLNYNKNIMYNEVLYNAFLNELLETISYTFDNVNEMLLVGHNPSLALLAYNLVHYKDSFEPSTVIKIEFDCNSWVDIDKENAKLIWVE